MNTATEDYAEMDTDDARRWVYRLRREYGIRKNEATCWFVDTEQNDGSDTKWLGRSPGDALDWAYGYARTTGASRRNGLGRWTMQVWGDGVNSPLVLRVYPQRDERLQ